MHTLLWELKALCDRVHEGSYHYRQKRSEVLLLAARQLTTRVERGGLGYTQMRLGDFERKHSRKLLALWQSQGLTVETLMNRYAHLRWWCEKIGKPDVIPPTNDFIKGERTGEVATVSKGQRLTPEELERISDPWIRLSVELQQAFGLRREEAICIRPHRADQGDRLWLKGSWCKGGRERTIPIETAEQRALLDRAKAFVRWKDASLIPPGKQSYQQINRYTYVIKQAGLAALHGLRHGHFQEKYAALTGHPVPVEGGPSRREMTEDERQRDSEVRQQLAEELGHGRARVTSHYFGR
jgi:hypothetical protein